MSATAASKFRSIRDFPELVDYLGDELDWPIATDDFEEMTFEYSAAELGLDERTAPKFLEIRRLRPLDKDQPWGIFFIRFDDNKLPVVALRRLLSKLVLNKRSTSNSGDRASWHESDLLLISQTGNLGTQSISFAHFAANPEKTDLPILKVLGWDDDDTGLKIDYVIETLREKLVWPEDPTDSNAWRIQWRDAFKLKNREVIQSSKEMAERLGQLALAVRTRLREVLAIESDEGPVHKLMSVFKENLISDLDTDSFSDMYAQTIAYGLLSARIINPKANTADAAHSQIPITNPFLRDLMETFLNVGGRSHSSGVGLDFDELGINEVVDLLDNTNMEAVLRDFGDRNQKEDPVMHFFEGFLQEYDSKIRKDRGVFYTPQPVVSFIVRSVDQQLRTEFGLEDGLADTTTWGELAERTKDVEIPEGTSPDQAFVQILDPATGTGTFPVEVIDLIYKTMMNKWKAQGITASQIAALWNDYVPKHLLPRLHGYELMMAPYAIAHMKVGLKLYETGYQFNSKERARIYLTNALEPAHDFSGTFAFAIPALAHEADSVNAIKRDARFTVLIGNPPYSNFGSQNKNPWILSLLDDYKKGLNERKINIDDDYIKFLRLGQNTCDASGSAVLGFITNNSFIDGVTHRAMRGSLVASFSKIEVIDLHGSSKRKEVSPDGSLDENVFDIQQGVSISLFCKNYPKFGTTRVTHLDIWGRRQRKYEQLSTRDHIKPLHIDAIAPAFLFIPTDGVRFNEFQSYASVSDLFVSSTTGVQTARDRLVVDFSATEVLNKISDFADLSLADCVISTRYNVSDARGWKLNDRRAHLSSHGIDASMAIPYDYRPFDRRYIYFDEGVVAWPRREILQNVVGRENLALLTTRGTEHPNRGIAFATRIPADKRIISAAKGEAKYFFANTYPHDGLLETEANGRTSNVSCGIAGTGTLAIYYMYAILFSPNYLKRYDAFLRLDYPRVPISGDASLAVSLSKLGERLVKLHLLESSGADRDVITVVGMADLQVEKVSYSNGTVWIDKAMTRGFRGVPEEVWNFYIGGYQVCEKWLKDRQAKGGKNHYPGRVLTDEDVEHYQKIVSALSETIRIMAEIDEVIDAHGGWPNAFVTTNR